jgi:hypothetical protein
MRRTTDGRVLEVDLLMFRLHVTASGRFWLPREKKRLRQVVGKRVGCRLKIPSCDEEDALELWATSCFWRDMTKVIDRYEYKNWCLNGVERWIHHCWHTSTNSSVLMSETV